MSKAFPRPVTERDRHFRSCLISVLPVGDLCAIVQSYAIEFRGLQYDPDYPQGYERADLWLHKGPIQVEGVCDLVAEFLQGPAREYTSPLCMMPNGAIVSGESQSKVTWSDGIESVTMGYLPYRVSTVVAFPDGFRVGVGTHCGLVAVWDMRNQSFEEMPEVSHGAVLSMIVLTDGKLTVGSSAQEVMVWDVNTKRWKWNWKSLSPSRVTLFPMVALPNGTFASGSTDALVRLWDIKPMTIRLLRGHREQINALALLPDGTLASASSDKTVLVWDVHSRACVRQLTGHSMPVISLAVLDNDRLAAGSMGNLVCVWHVSTGTCLQRLWGPGGPVRTLAVLRDGELAAGSDDGTVNVWDPDSGECVHFLRGHSGHVISHLLVLPNGQLVSGGRDNTLGFWI